MNYRWLCATLSLALLLAEGTASSRVQNTPPQTRLYLFFSPECTGVDRLAAQIRKTLSATTNKLPFRPVLLVEDFSDLSRLMRDPESSFMKATHALASKRERQVKSAGGNLKSCKARDFHLPLFDREGLELARKFRITRLPAVVLVHNGLAHKAYGSEIDLSLLMRCR